MSKKPYALIILDGFGKNERHEGNAIYAANTPNIDKYLANHPNSIVHASGLDVGLPDGQMGNSEVGHTNIGAGRIVYQELTRITKSIEDGDFFENEALVKAVENCKKNDSALHLMGLLSPGGVHSHTNHLYGLLRLAKMNGIEKVHVHAFLDGRDVPLDELKIENLIESLKSSDSVIVKNVTKGVDIKAKLDLSERQRAMLIAGGLLNYTREKA